MERRPMSRRIDIDAAGIRARLLRRPCTGKQIEAALGLQINEASNDLGHLIQRRRIHTNVMNGEGYDACR